MRDIRLRELIGGVVNEGEPAEAIIIDAKFTFLGKGFIVLCVIPERGEFVTWWMNNEMQTFNGHYTTELNDSVKEFYTRGS